MQKNEKKQIEVKDEFKIKKLKIQKKNDNSTKKN